MKKTLRKLTLKKEIIAQLDNGALSQVAGGIQQSNPCSDFRRCDALTDFCPASVSTCFNTIKPCLA